MRVFRYLSSEGGVAARIAVASKGLPAVDLLDSWAMAMGELLEYDEGQFLVSTASLIEQGPELWKGIDDLAKASAHHRNLQVDEYARGFRRLCPLDRVGSLRDFLAFEDHVENGAKRRGTEVPAYWYEAPVYYKGNHRAVIGPEDECPWPDYTERLDFELEMAMVVGKRGRDVTSTNAGDHIFGFTVLNDFSARDIQAEEMGAWLGPAKGKDFANAIGPSIITVDELGAEPDLEMICRVNGDEWGRARTSEAKWSWSEMIEHVSRSEDIYPGDVYGSGTPGGCCGLDLNRELEPGDIVELEIERIGILRNAIGKPGRR